MKGWKDVETFGELVANWGPIEGHFTIFVLYTAQLALEIVTRFREKWPSALFALKQAHKHLCRVSS